MYKPGILVIDDDPACLRMISTKALDDSRYQVFTASSCAEGIRLATSCQPDCILLDYYLKDGKAAVVCKAVRSDESLKKTPIIVISGDPTQNIEAEKDCQADRFIAKGVPLAEYDAAIQSLLRRVSWERGILEKGDLRLEAATGMVSKDGKLAAHLSGKQFRLFALLVERSPGFVDADAVLRTVMPLESAPEDSGAVKMLVCRLRQSLGVLARRLKSTRNKGWAYVQPRPRVAAAKPQTGCTTDPN
jgi:two-component system KDP operon response regulator KdpE